MGRAKGGSVVGAVATGSRRVGVGGRVRAAACEIDLAELLASASGRVGEVIEINGEPYTLQEGDHAAALAGLAAVSDVQHLPNGLYRVVLADGAVAMVDLDGFALAYDVGDELQNADILGALYAAMGSKAMAETDPEVSAPNSPAIALGDAYAAFSEQREARARAQQMQALSDNADEDEAASELPAISLTTLTALAAAAQTQLAQTGETLSVNPENLQRLLTPVNAKPLSKREATRLAMTNWRQTVSSVMAQAQAQGDDPQLRAAQALLCAVDGSGNLSSLPTETTEAEYEAAAEALGHKIPELKIQYNEDGESIGDFEVGAAEKERIDMIRNALGVGDRAFAFRGPPGSGKGELASQLAAIMHAPFVPINVGPSSDLEQNIGGDGLRTQIVEIEEPMFNSVTGEPLMEPVLDAKGNPKIDADGPVMKPHTYTRQQPMTVSDMMVGPLAEAASHPCIIEIQEPEGMEQEAIRLHSLLGEKVGEPEMRFLNINSSAAGKRISIPVHPDCIIIFTYNPGLEDVKLKQATHDRCVNLDFDYPTKEAECRRLARMVNRVLRNPRNQVPDHLREDLDPKVMEPFVAIVEKMRNVARERPSYIESPGSRTAARLCLQLMAQSSLGDSRADRTVRLLLDFCRSYEDKHTDAAPDTEVQSLLGDELLKLQELCDGWYKAGTPFRDDKSPGDVAAATKKPKTSGS